MKEEVWKDIPDYEGLYQASNLGRIRRISSETIVGKRVIHKRTLIMHPFTLKHNGRKDYRIVLTKNRKKKSFYVSRLVLSAFKGKSDLTANHINGKTLDNRIENLEWCSLSENIQKGYDNGLFKKTTRGIIVFDKKTNEKYQFQSCMEASRYFNVGRTHWFRKNNITHCRKYRWQFL